MMSLKFRRPAGGSNRSKSCRPCGVLSAVRPIAYLCADTLIALFNSLMSLEISLFFKINSLFRILGNFRKKHRWLLRFLTSNR